MWSTVSPWTLFNTRLTPQILLSADRAYHQFWAGNAHPKKVRYIGTYRIGPSWVGGLASLK